MCAADLPFRRNGTLGRSAWIFTCLLHPVGMHPYGMQERRGWAAFLPSDASRWDALLPPFTHTTHARPLPSFRPERARNERAERRNLPAYSRPVCTPCVPFFPPPAVIPTGAREERARGAEEPPRIQPSRCTPCAAAAKERMVGCEEIPRYARNDGCRGVQWREACSYLIPHTSYLIPHTSYLIPHTSYLPPFPTKKTKKTPKKFAC
jgi:hypothetical protein